MMRVELRMDEMKFPKPSHDVCQITTGLFSAFWVYLITDEPFGRHSRISVDLFPYPSPHMMRSPSGTLHNFQVQSSEVVATKSLIGCKARLVTANECPSNFFVIRISCNTGIAPGSLSSTEPFNLLGVPIVWPCRQIYLTWHRNWLFITASLSSFEGEMYYVYLRLSLPRRILPCHQQPFSSSALSRNFFPCLLSLFGQEGDQA